ncbi:unnamed protein product [Nippostrongylus brasiliensis]|uniref:COesterase domain-containing protein n=1 Tax=Nippostrongylus brasiliensis TaxID=27835 RepID=A0A0N4XZT2_NIPBR|nr:unnamed protein product [Nippostrongylus brasiliensis]
MAKTIFGPTIYGRGSLEAETIKPILYGMTAVTDLSENEMLKNLFELEGLSIFSDENSQDEKANNYLEQYAKSISFESGYVVAPFPLKENVADLSDNYPVAARRLMALQLTTTIWSHQRFIFVTAYFTSSNWDTPPLKPIAILCMFLVKKHLVHVLVAIG